MPKESFLQLATLPVDERKRRGFHYTFSEIVQQPGLWPRVLEGVGARRREIARFLREAGVGKDKGSTVVLAGAGSSEYVGNTLVPLLRQQLGCEVLSVPTTHLVTHLQSAFLPDRPYLVVSFARSGDSPESVATYELVRGRIREARQLVITCNRDGALARLAAADSQAFCHLLPEESNDQSLAMTSSFSSMALAGAALGYLDAWDGAKRAVEQASARADRIIHEHEARLSAFAASGFTRACYLGSNVLRGAVQEARLKMIELTGGAVAAIFDSFMGIRHGPKVFINSDCAVMASLSDDELVQRYELDLLRELKAQGQARSVIAVCERVSDEIREVSDAYLELRPAANAGAGRPAAGAGPAISLPDHWRFLPDIVAWQILAACRSVELGLSPDQPSPNGIISRVVSGVTIHSA